jgi:hypothetical protein
MENIVRGSTERQLTEMCRQCTIKLGIVSTVTNVTGTGIHFLAHAICVFVRSLITKAKYFLNYGDMNVEVHGYWLSATRVNARCLTTL